MAAITETRTEKIIVWLVTGLLLLICFTAIYPIINVAATSFSSSTAAERGQVFLVPVEFTLESWKYVVANKLLWRSFFNSVFVAVVGSVLSLIFTAMLAYPLANKHCRWSKWVMIMVVITMVFRYPLIPYFLTIRALGLMDTLWVLIATHLLVAYNLVIMRTFFMQLPEELEEAALIEGANHFQILYKVIIPLSKPAMATLGLFYAVTYWNLFLHPMMFISSPKNFTLQPRLREFIAMSQDMEMMMEAVVDFNRITVEAATIMFATIPILCVYPFLQKYFVKGAMLGSLKG